jgi:hypothetical protein
MYAPKRDSKSEVDTYDNELPRIEWNHARDVQDGNTLVVISKAIHPKKNYKMYSFTISHAYGEKTSKYFRPSDFTSIRSAINMAEDWIDKDREDSIVASK